MKNIPRKRIPLSLEIAPLVDIVLLLLIFFLLTFSLGLQSMKLDLPEASTADRAKENLTVLINREGEIFVEGEKISLEALFPFLRSKLKKEKIKTVTIKADADVPIKVPVQVMDICRRAGAQGISIATKKGGS